MPRRKRLTRVWAMPLVWPLAHLGHKLEPRAQPSRKGSSGTARHSRASHQGAKPQPQRLYLTPCLFLTSGGEAATQRLFLTQSLDSQDLSYIGRRSRNLSAPLIFKSLSDQATTEIVLTHYRWSYWQN